MLKLFKLILLLIIISISESYSQSSALTLSYPKEKDWNIINEGETLKFKIKASGDSLVKNLKFNIQQGKVLGMNLDSTGVFTWQPAFHLVDRIEGQKLFQIIVEANSENGKKGTTNIEFIVKHVNRLPRINELKVFYVKYNSSNTYAISANEVFDEDLDPIVFIPSLESFPQGMNMSSRGEIEWNPSFSQFKSLKEKPIFIEFYVQDQPAKTQTKGRLKIDITQLDLPPEITIIPKKDYFKIKENENLNLRFYLSDPNGDEDIEAFDFLTNHSGLNKPSLIKNTNNQYEFIWMPGYEFVQDPKDSVSFTIDFFVLDKTQKREVKQIKITVLNTVNEAETDKKNYNLYFGTVTRAWELLEQLKEKEEELKKSYNRARKGKKQRSVVNASLGATTGISSIFTKQKPDTQRLISTVGGTTVLTIGTLEATEVIGKSMKDLIDRLNYVIEKKNELQTKGDIFARDYSLKSTRRNSDFLKKTDEFMSIMNLKGLVALELNAAWESKKKPTETSIKKSFKDFNPW